MRGSSGRSLRRCRTAGGADDGVVYLKVGALYFRAPVQGEAHVERQAVYNLPRVVELEVQVAKVIQMYLVEVEQAVGHGLQVVQHVAAVDTVAVAHIHMHGGTLAGPVVEVGTHAPVKLFTRKIVTYLRPDAQQAVARKEAVVLKFLLVRETVAAAIAQQEGVDEGRAAHTAYLCQVNGVAAGEHIAYLPPKL